MQNRCGNITRINRNNLPSANLLTLGHSNEFDAPHLTAALAMSNIFVLPTYNPLKEKIQEHASRMFRRPHPDPHQGEGVIPAERARGFSCA